MVVWLVVFLVRDVGGGSWCWFCVGLVGLFRRYFCGCFGGCLVSLVGC